MPNCTHWIDNALEDGSANERPVHTKKVAALPADIPRTLRHADLGLIASHSPSDAMMRRPPVIGHVNWRTSGVGSVKSPPQQQYTKQMASPIKCTVLSCDDTNGTAELQTNSAKTKRHCCAARWSIEINQLANQLKNHWLCMLLVWSPPDHHRAHWRHLTEDSQGNIFLNQLQQSLDAIIAKKPKPSKEAFTYQHSYPQSSDPWRVHQANPSVALSHVHPQWTVQPPPPSSVSAPARPCSPPACGSHSPAALLTQCRGTPVCHQHYQWSPPTQQAKPLLPLCQNPARFKR